MSDPNPQLSVCDVANERRNDPTIPQRRQTPTSYRGTFNLLGVFFYLFPFNSSGPEPTEIQEKTSVETYQQLQHLLGVGVNLDELLVQSRHLHR